VCCGEVGSGGLTLVFRSLLIIINSFHLSEGCGEPKGTAPLHMEPGGGGGASSTQTVHDRFIIDRLISRTTSKASDATDENSRGTRE